MRKRERKWEWWIEIGIGCWPWQTNRHLEKMVDDLNAGKPQCPVGLNTLVLPRKSTLPPPDQTPYVYLKCGHVQGLHHWGKEGESRTCPICLKARISFIFHTFHLAFICNFAANSSFFFFQISFASSILTERLSKEGINRFVFLLLFVCFRWGRWSSWVWAWNRHFGSTVNHQLTRLILADIWPLRKQSSTSTLLLLSFVFHVNAASLLDSVVAPRGALICSFLSKVFPVVVWFVRSLGFCGAHAFHNSFSFFGDF